MLDNGAVSDRLNQIQEQDSNLFGSNSMKNVEENAPRVQTKQYPIYVPTLKSLKHSAYHMAIFNQFIGKKGGKVKYIELPVHELKTRPEPQPQINSSLPTYL